ncbi:hypothetical protein JXM67_08090 [candidate division WOR-3 bacterium]|nr:hypothetical protein [candidate division WOR-3 bacterium]
MEEARFKGISLILIGAVCAFGMVLCFLERQPTFKRVTALLFFLVSLGQVVAGAILFSKAYRALRLLKPSGLSPEDLNGYAGVRKMLKVLDVLQFIFLVLITSFLILIGYIAGCFFICAI